MNEKNEPGELSGRLVMLLFGAVALLVGYGILMIVFRSVLGIELPNPIDWFLPEHWRERFHASRHI
jgi:hypothetical protein